MIILIMAVLGGLISFVNPWSFGDWQYWVNMFIPITAYIMGWIAK
jgi:hypothetical protein